MKIKTQWLVFFTTVRNTTTFHFAPDGALVCAVQFSHHTVIFVLCNFHRLDFLMEAYSVLCEVHAETLFTGC
jgi:hypothetical protein